MVKALFFSLITVMAICASALAQETKIVKGEVIDISCYTAAAAKGEDHKTCALACIEAGEPAGILEDGTSKIYTVITTDHTNPAKKITPFVGKTVEASGAVYERNGITTIDIKEIKEAANAAAETGGAKTGQAGM